jgi:transposase InsO family protein
VDRDSVFSPRFKSILGSSGVEILLTAYQAPNMNAHAERFVRSIRLECLDQMIFVGRASLEKAIAEYVAYYHRERSHQGLGNEIPGGVPVQRDGVIQASERLGGLLKYYHRRAA